MRNRRQPSALDAAESDCNVCSAVSTRDAARTASAPSSPSDTAGRAKLGLDVGTNDPFAVRLRKVVDDAEMRRVPFWRLRCSSSILLGLLIWLMIGLVVFWRLDVQPPLSDADLGPSTASLLPDGCAGSFCLDDGGTEPFGAVLGAHDGVYAYSNCNAHTCVSFVESQYPIPLPHGAHTAQDAPQARVRLMTSGMKWQCVEYARRYWMLRGRPVPAVFGSVDGAADIWEDLAYVTLLDNVTRAPLLKYANGARLGLGGSAPRKGDLVIYPRDNVGMFPFGHVAVILGVDMPAAASDALTGDGAVYIGEQNWHSSKWPAPYHNYSRVLPLRVEYAAPGTPVRYTIDDSYHSIQGWIRYDAE